MSAAGWGRERVSLGGLSTRAGKRGFYPRGAGWCRCAEQLVCLAKAAVSGLCCGPASSS